MVEGYREWGNILNFFKGGGTCPGGAVKIWAWRLVEGRGFIIHIMINNIQFSFDHPALLW